MAQAQHDFQKLTDLLEEGGIHVKSGVHPVAGRMPGRMNVLPALMVVDHAKNVIYARVSIQKPGTGAGAARTQGPDPASRT